LFFFALGLMAKPMLVTLPFVMLLLDYWPLHRMSTCNGRPATALRLAWEKWPFFLLTAASCVVTYLAQNCGEAVISLQRFPLNLRMENALTAYAQYLLKTLWPVNLAVIYPLPRTIPWFAALAAAAVLISLSAAAWQARKRSPYGLVGWLWFLGPLVPVIGLVQVGGAAMADRYTYFPLIGVFLAVAFGIRDLARRFQFLKPTGIAAAVMVLAGCLILTENQLRYWRDSESLFIHALAVTKDNYLAHLNLGTVFQNEGRLNEALAEYREAARLSPGYFRVHGNLGSLLDDMGRPEEALAEYHLALRLKSNLPTLHDGMGIVLVELGRFDEAMSEFAGAARLDPAYPWPYFQMGKALLGQGRDTEAIDKLREALRINPDNYQILAYVARVLAANEKPEVRDGQTALVYAVKANVLSDGTLPFVLDALGMACAETGRFDDAQEAIERAINMATAAGMNQDVASMQQRLRLYQNHQPWRESFLSTNTRPRDLPKN
jgi:tetratricopeptide (TPR) repeat protein